MNWQKEVIYHLQNYRANQNAIKQLEERLANKETQKYSIKRQTTEDVRVQSGNNTDNLLNVIIECEELRKQIRNVKYEIRWIENGLKCLDCIEIKCLTEFYINNNTRAAIELSKQLNYSNAHIYRIRNNALTKLVANLYGCC